MNATEFDRLIKRVSGAADRRRLLAGLLGLAVSGGLGTREAVADETPKANGKKCIKDVQCQSGHCCTSGTAKHGVCQDCCDDAACSTDQVCRGGTCVACGGLDEPCCTRTRRCDDSRLLCVDGTCVACGSSGEPCCSSGTCFGSRNCTDSTCVDCGRLNQPCCVDGDEECRVSQGLTCQGNFCLPS